MIRPWYITMRKLKGYFQIVTLILYMHTYGRCTGKEAVYITVLDSRPLRANDGPRFQCYQTNTEITPRTYGRYVYTKNGEANNLPPRPAHQHSSNRNAQIIYPDTRTGLDGFGVFYCQGTQPNKITTTIPTVMLRNDGKLQPKGGVFTKTVNKGDIDVTVEVERANNDLTNTELYWRFNGSDTHFFSGTRPAALTYTISGPVSGEHEGVYEVYYINERNLGRHAIMRLIVRDCISGRWGPPDCYGICDQCYNGGVCDDLTGKCICPPGFMGDNCLTGCGGNRFGINCEFRCTQTTADPEDYCDKPIFCLPDPYGCTCNTGYHTLDCGDLCLSGTFGASCTQQCHCTSGTCNAYTGACADGYVCETGWSGTSCQIPSVCPNDYFGSQCTLKCHCLNDVPCDKNTGECPNLQCSPGYNVYDSDNFVYCQDCMGSTFGHECSGVCHCNADTCNQVTGECDGGCLVNWIEPDCQTGVQSVTNTKVNLGQATVFTCVVTGNPTPTRQFVILERSGGDTTGITFRSESSNDTSRYMLFDVNQVDADEPIGCRITTPPGAYIIEPSKTFDLPEFTTAPRVTEIGGLFVSIKWDEWDGISGDGPVVSYRVHYNLASVSSWSDGDIISNGLMTTIEDLRWETEYVFSVAAIREGEGGQGPRGPNSAIVTTVCAEPLPPQGLVAMRNQPKQIVVRWEAPSEDRLRCSTGVLHYTVFYRLTEDDTHQEQSMNTTATETTIRGLETYSEYNFHVTVRNEIGMSAYSESLNYFTVEEAPPAPIAPTILSTTLTSITLLLEAEKPYNLNGIIKSYEIKYQMVSPTIEDKQYMTVVNDEFSVVANINDLKGNSNYLIRIRIQNGAGVSPWSENVLATSINSEPSATFSTGATIGISVGITAILFIIIALLMMVYLKRRGRQSSLTEDGALETTTMTTGKDMKETRPDHHDTEEYEDIELGDIEYEDVTSSKYEVAWEDLDLAGKILGKGNFGEVQLGRVWIKGKWVKAAIKTLKDGAPESEGILFKKEFDIMVNVGYHRNVVNILGSCDHEDTFYVIIEFVPFGDLRKFLRKSRKNAQQLKNAGNPVSELSPDQLLKFAIDISQGMAHLASCGIIHRDLAARNVLVGNGLTAKVADFGMSRSEDIYVQTSSQRVPTRWLSPESLDSKVYTTKSDVWSFGIVLWEIATFGGTPYPGVETRQLSYKLAEGYRMSKPENCQDDIYEMMLKCWQEKALDRPSFSEIDNVLTNMSAESDTIYMSTNGYQNFKFSPIHVENDGN